MLLQVLLGAGVVLSASADAFAEDNEHHDNNGGEHSGGGQGGGGQSGGSDDSDDSNDPGSGSESPESSDSSQPSSNWTAGGAPAQSVGQSSGSGSRRFLNQDEVKKVVASGNAASLPLLLAYVGQNYPGDVLDVKMRRVDGGYAYDVKVLSNLVVLRTVSLEAKTLKKL
jgi:hypothetical protein